MNILLLCDEYPPGKHGGIGTAVQTLARELVAAGHIVVVAGFYDYSYGGQCHFLDKGVQVYRFKRKLKIPFKKVEIVGKAINKLYMISGIWDLEIKNSLLKYHVFLEGLIKQYEIDLVERPDFNDYIRFCRKKRVLEKLSVPVVVKLHGSMTYFAEEAGKEIKPYIKETEYWYLKEAEAISSVSSYTAMKTAEYFRLDRPIEILYNGIEPQEETVYDKESGTVVFTGALSEKKGIFQLLKAWNIVVKKMPDVRLSVLGKGDIQKAASFLDGKAMETVTFMGHVTRDELFMKMKQTEVAVFPSYAECFALAPMEAMVNMAAVIYTTRASGPELITNGENGLLIDPDDVQGIADAIIRLLEDGSERKKIAINGKRRIEEAFLIQNIAQKNLDFYRKVIQKKNRNNYFN
ncbi:glycosyltransferase family 4 protein [Taibaiella soli]|uniref:Glycosyltransferase family 1 protein n=1 Tax=Taibaiella soli TaxID=1649169 RepID=A0A2W2BX10_9BACT|nr:glycosyltransferase family 4 protein [Taibaiella soli]PZF72393.1 hypothetical protein DN068_13650 [Taibaiella soli]